MRSLFNSARITASNIVKKAIKRRHIDTGAVGTDQITSATIQEQHIDWASYLNIAQLILNKTESTNTGAAFSTIETIPIYIPASATVMEYMVRHKRNGASATSTFRLTHSAHSGSSLTTTSASYTNSTGGTLDVGDESGLTSINLQHHSNDGTDSASYTYVVVFFR